MKIKKLLSVILCMILSICAFSGGCEILQNLVNKEQDNGHISTEQPEDVPDEYISDGNEDADDGNVPVDAEQEESHVHTLTFYSKVNATCTTDGTAAYWGCSGCGKYFADKNAKNEITSIVIYASGHTYSIEWSSDETYHWHAATCGHTDEVKDKEVHSYNAEHICVCGKVDIENTVTYGMFTENDFLMTDGTDVITKSGETVYLRGTNAGGLFVAEHWMTGFETGKTYSDDFKSVTLKFIERFGEELTKQLWSEYRANWWTDTDFQNCADMGMTVIRLPFTYMNVDFAAITDYEEAGKNYDFSDLDEFINRAAEYGLYVILDLHGAYGSQNGQDHSGEIIADKADVDFYSNQKMQELTLKLWGALAEHYKDNPVVAGYDILNEPAEKGGSTSASHWSFYDKVYKIIRAAGDDHIIIFESCWEWYNLPEPSRYGWTNCIYSFHHYVDDGLTVEGHVSNWTNKLSGISAQNFNLPLQMGEFTAYDSTEKWERTLELLNSNNWHYTSWTYKVWGTMAWGIVNISGNKVDPSSDSYSDIIAKFKNLRTENGEKYTFKDSGRTLESIMRELLKQI